MSNAVKLLERAQALMPPDLTIVPKVRTPTDKYYRWGVNNLYPNGVDDLVKSCAIATTCANQLVNVIAGLGVENGNFAVNSSGQTLNGLIAGVARSVAIFRGFGLLVKYATVTLDDINFISPLSKIDSISLVSMQDIRPSKETDENGEPAGYYVSANWAAVNDKLNKERFYPAYNPTRAGRQFAEATEHEPFLGQLLVRYTSDENSLFPTSYIHSCLREMYILAANLQWIVNQVDNAFMPNAIAHMKGDANASLDPTEEDGGKAGQEVLDTLREVGTGEAKGGIVLIQGGELEITPFNATLNGEELNIINEMLNSNIASAFGVPPVLAGIQTAGKLGQSNETIQAWEYLVNTQGEALGRFILNVLNIPLELWQSGPIVLTDIKRKPPLSQLTPEMSAVMTTDEKRAFLGLPPLTELQVL